MREMEKEKDFSLLSSLLTVNAILSGFKNPAPSEMTFPYFKAVFTHVSVVLLKDNEAGAVLQIAENANQALHRKK